MAIGRALDRAGVTVWLDEWNLVPGDDFQPAIEKALASCSACVVFIGPGGIGPWQNHEMQVAITRRIRDPEFRVIPVLLPGAERRRRSQLPAFLVTATWVEFRREVNDPDSLQRLVDGIRGVRGHGITREALVMNRCPYRGLEAFDIEHADIFFGREALTDWILSDLRPEFDTPRENRVVALVGPSGSGKSSLARAGLLASIRNGGLPGSSSWPQFVCAPGSEPIRRLVTAFSAHSDASDPSSAAQELADEIQNDASALHRAVMYVTRPLAAPARCVILVDQFEELFTLCHDDRVRVAFIDNLLTAATRVGGRAIVILAMRADYYGDCARYPALAAAMSDHQLLVGPMAREELSRAVLEPALRSQREFESGLVDVLLNDAENEPGGLPLLQYALKELWARAAGSHMTHGDYTAIGGVTGALARRAEQVYKGMTDSEQAACRRIFLRLTQQGESGERTRRRAGKLELMPASGDRHPIERVVTLFASTQVRLLVTSGQGPEPFVEVAHEALLSSWPRLLKWLDEDRDARRIHARLSRTAQEWNVSGREPSHLYRETMLSIVEEWASTHETDLNELEHEFLGASVDRAVQDFLHKPIGEVTRELLALQRGGRWTKACLWTLYDRNDVAAPLRRRVALALLGDDETIADALGDALLIVDPAEFRIIADALADRLTRLADSLWKSLSDASIPKHSRFRAACALARCSGNDERWSSLAALVVDFLVAENPLFLGAWIDLLKPIGHALRGELRARFSGLGQRDETRQAAALALVKFANNDPHWLALLASQAASSTYEFVYNALADTGVDRAAVIRELEARLRPEPTSPVSSAADRVAEGVGRAGAAITLFRLGAVSSARPVFQIGSDPESLFQFVHRARERNVQREQLVELLSEPDITETELFGCLLSLGEFDADAMGPASALARKVLAIYERDYRRSVHSACAWLLRKRGMGRQVLESDMRAARVSPSGAQQWVVRAIGDEFLTFIRVGPGVFTMGSPEGEPGRGGEERQREVALAKQFEISDRLVTRRLFERFLAATGIDAQAIDEWSPSKNHPYVSATWEEAALFCRWLTLEAGLPEAEQNYVDRHLEVGFEHQVSLDACTQGYRLLTEAEWEYACRAGTVTAYSFGSDPTLLTHYGRYLANSAIRRTAAVASLRPNLWGLFDMHGNVYEWCQDWYGPYEDSKCMDPVGPASGPGRVLRGGGYNYSDRDCRSAYRYYTHPTNRNARIGFRVARTTDGQ